MTSGTFIVEVYVAGQKSPLGTKRMITNRFNKLSLPCPKEQLELIKEIDELVGYTVRVV